MAERSAGVLAPIEAKNLIRIASNSLDGISQTIRPYISTNLRNESQANTGSLLRIASALAISGDIPTLRTVSIIPGMENFAPDLTDTKSGLDGSPNCRPTRRSNFATSISISVSSWDERCLRSKKSRQAEVVIVKPSGTGIPRVIISERLAPFPPKSSPILRLPSEKGKTKRSIVNLL